MKLPSISKPPSSTMACQWEFRGDALDSETAVGDRVFVFVPIGDALKMFPEQELNRIDPVRLVDLLLGAGVTEGIAGCHNSLNDDICMMLLSYGAFIPAASSRAPGRIRQMRERVKGIHINPTEKSKKMNLLCSRKEEESLVVWFIYDE